MSYTKEQIQKGFEIYNEKYQYQKPESFKELSGDITEDAKGQTEFLIMCIEKTDEEINEYLKSKE